LEILSDLSSEALIAVTVHWQKRKAQTHFRTPRKIYIVSHLHDALNGIYHQVVVHISVGYGKLW